MRLLIHLVLALVLVAAALVLAHHLLVLQALRATAEWARQQERLLLIIEGRAAELLAEQVVPTWRSDPGPVPRTDALPRPPTPEANPGPEPAETRSALDGADWQKQIDSDLGWLQANPPLDIAWWVWILGMVLLLVCLWRWAPGLMHSLPVTLGCAVVIAVAFFAVLNDIVVPVRAKTLLEARSQRHSYRNDFLQASGLTRLPADLAEAERSAAFKKAAATFLTARKDAAEALQLLPPSDRPAHVRLWELLQQSDAELIEELERQLLIGTRVLPRPGNTWVGYNEPDHLRAASGEHGFSGAALFTSDAVRNRLVPLAARDQDKPESKEAPRPGVKLLGVLLVGDLERLQTDPVIILVRRANGPFQFAIALLFVLGLLLFTRRWLAAGVQRRKLWRALPRIPSTDLLTGQTRPTGGPLDWVSVEARQAELERRHREQRERAFAGDPGGKLLHDTYGIFLQTRRPAAADEALHRATQALSEEQASERTFLEYIAWVLPSIGITATAFGIGNALLQAGKLLDPSGESADALQRFFSELGVTFDVTLFALGCSIIMMWLLQRLRRIEESALFWMEKTIRSVVVVNLSTTNREVEVEFQDHGQIRQVVAELLEFRHAPGLPTENGASLALRVLVDHSAEQAGCTLLPPGTVIEVPLVCLTESSFRTFVETYYEIDISPSRRAARGAWLRLRASPEPRQRSRTRSRAATPSDNGPAGHRNGAASTAF